MAFLSFASLSLPPMNCTSLALQTRDVENLQAHFANLSDIEIEARLQQALFVLHLKMQLLSSSVRCASACIHQLAKEVQRAIGLHTLDKVFVVRQVG